MTTHPEQAAALSALRRIATEAHKRVEHARISGERWTTVRYLDGVYLNAVRLVYSYEAMTRNRETVA